MFSFIPAVLIQIQISSGLRKDDVLQCLSICMKLRGNEAELERNRRLMKEAGSKVLRGWNAKSCLYLMCYLVVFLKKKLKIINCFPNIYAYIFELIKNFKFCLYFSTHDHFSDLLRALLWCQERFCLRMICTQVFHPSLDLSISVTLE